MELFIQKLKPQAKLPLRSHTSAGFDLFACQDVVIPAGFVGKIPLGFATSFDEKYVALIWDRGSMAAQGYHRFAGVVDHDYRGEWQVVMYNSSNECKTIFAGQKVAQVLFQLVEFPFIMEVDKLEESKRGTGAFGSTGA